MQSLLGAAEPFTPEKPEPKIYLHTKIRTSTYGRLLTFMAENNLEPLGEIVDIMLTDCLDVAKKNAEKKKGTQDTRHAKRGKSR